MQETIQPTDIRLPVLDDSKTLRALLQSQAQATAARLSEAQQKNVARQEVIDTDKKAAAMLAATLMGKNPAFKAPVINTPEKFERNLRQALTAEFEKLGIKPEELNNSLDLFQVSSYIFTNEVHALIQQLSAEPEKIEENGPKALNDLLDRWCSILERQ